MKIIADNFLSWKHLEFEVESGVTLIDGFNHDDGTSEGSGKSAILNALAWGCYGEIPKDANIDEVVMQGEKFCQVQIIHRDFSITRKRGPNDLFYQYVAGKPLRGKSAVETQKQIEKLLGMTFKTFCQCIYFPQNYPNKFVTANQEEKGRILSEILDLEQFDRARKVAAEKIKLNKEELIKAEKDKEKFITLLDGANSDFKAYSDLITEFYNKKTASIQAMFNSLEGLNAEAEAFLQEFEREKEKDITTLQKMIELEKLNQEAIVDELNSVESENKALDIEALVKEQETLEADNRAVEAARSSYKVKFATINQVLQAQEKTKKEFATKQKDITTLLVSIQNKAQDIEGARSDIQFAQENYDAAIAALNNPEKSECPTCGQPWSGDPKHYQDAVAIAKKTLNKENETLEKYQKEYRTMELRAETLESEIEALGVEIESFEALDATKLQARIRQTEEVLENNHKMLKACIAKQQTEDRLKLRIENLQEKLEAKNIKIAGLHIDIANTEAREPTKELEQFRARAEALETQIEAKDKEEPISLLKNLELAKQRQAQFAADQDAAQIMVDSIKSDILRLEANREGFREVKIYTFENTLNALNRKANKYLSELFTQPVKVKFKAEDMKIECLVTIDGLERSLSLYSGGQHRRISLAVDLALSDVTLARKGSKLSLIALDEPFKDLSEESMKRTLEILQKRTAPVLIIEHNSLIKQIVNHSVSVELRDKVSRMV